MCPNYVFGVISVFFLAKNHQIFALKKPWLQLQREKNGF